MYPHERSLVKQLSGKPFALIGINSDGSSEEELEKIRKIVKEKDLNWRSFQDKGGQTPISDTWKIAGWPTVFILDAEGKIRLKGEGDFDKVIEECLAEMGHDVEIKHTDED